MKGKQLLVKLGRAFAKNSPTILTGMAGVGVVTTAIMAVQATPKALAIIDDEVFRRYEDSLVDKDISYVEYLNCPEGYSISERMKTLPRLDLVRLTWRCYAPSILMGGLTIGCIIGANSINLRRNAALASVYSLSEAALKEYQAKVIETFGEAKERKVRDEIAKDQIANKPVGRSEIILTGKGDTLCYDAHSDRYFKSDIEKIRRTLNELNRDLLSENFLSLNDVYFALGLGPIKFGEEMGWDVNNGLIDFSFSSALTEDGTPCLVINYYLEPKYNFRDY